MKSKKQILRKIKEFETNPMFVTGIYRLVVFLKFEDIPEKYQSFFNEEQKEKWEDPSEKLVEDLDLDIDTGIRSVLKSLYKRNVVQSIGIIPMILSDMFMDDKPIGRLQGQLSKLIENYLEDINVLGPNLAEVQTIINVGELFKEIVKVQRLDIKFNIDEIIEDIIGKINVSQDLESHKALNVLNSKTLELPDDIDSIVDKALDDYESKSGDESIE